MENKFAVIIATYKRPDGRTPEFLKRALDSVFSQTYKNFKIFLVGDKYEDDLEFIKIAESYDPDKIYYKNLDHIPEREEYKGDNEKIWCLGGYKASKHAIEKSKEEGYHLLCRLDHDDYWGDNHLLNMNIAFNKNPDYAVVAGLSNYRGLYHVPVRSRGDFIPEAGDIIHSSTCINFKVVKISYRNIFEEEGIVEPGDADFWKRLGSHMRENNMIGHVTDEISCYLDKKERT